MTSRIAIFFHLPGEIGLHFSLNFYHYPVLRTGLTSAFWVWLGFIMPVQASAEIFGGKKWALFAINTGYQLVSVLAMGAILGILG